MRVTVMSYGACLEFIALLILRLMLTRRTFLQLMAASTGAALSGTEYLATTAARAGTARFPGGSRGVEHVVILMMENRSFDHFLSWLPGADGRHDMTYLSTDGNVYPNYPLAPDFQGCGYSDPDHSWEGFLIQHNFGKMDGFLQRPTAPEDNPGVTLAAANTFPVGYYTNFRRDGRRKQIPDLPVIGALAEHYTTLEHYFCSFAGETFPNRFYQHAARTDRDHNNTTISTLPTIWDQLSPVPNTQGIPTGGYFFRDLPFLALWGLKYFPFWHPFAPGDTDALGIPVTTPSFIDTVAAGNLPNVTFDEWGGFFDHVPPPHVIDDTDPATVDHTGDGTTPTDGQLVPDYTQLGFRVPAIVVSNLALPRVVHHGPFEHTSTLRLVESAFGLRSLTARDANTEDIGQVLRRERRPAVPPGVIPVSSDVPGPASDAAAVCSASSVQSVSPAPVGRHQFAEAHVLHKPGFPTGAGMVGFGQEFRKGQSG